MTALSPPSFIHSATWAICLTLLFVASPSLADDLAPVFPDESLETPELVEPLPIPKRNPLLERPKSRQVVFDELDPVGSVMSPGLQRIEELAPAPQNVQQKRSSVDASTAFFTDENGENGWGNGKVVGEYSCDADSFCAGSFPVAFGMGLLDNLTLFAESTTFKTGLNGNGGSMGLGEGLNWSAAVTPQGAATAQFGVRAVQGDLHSQAARSQVFMTAGLFRRFDFARLQGGVAIDWLHDHSGHFGSVDLRQMRCELSMRSYTDLEYGFLGGFNVFQDYPIAPRTRSVIDVHDYYLLFARKHLPNGGQLELRCGSTALGDFVIGAQGESVISDRLAVNGGITMLAPSGGSRPGQPDRECWSMSLGVVIYFRGGAMSRQINSHRPMFDVAGNNSFLTRLR